MIEPIARTMTGQILTRIRAKIISGEYSPGAALLQDSIASEFGVSKIPVREALVQLKSEGLVDIFTHRGFQVRALTAREMQEVFNLRLAIEPGAVAEGARGAADEDKSAARAALNALNASLTRDRLEHSGDLNAAFHLALIVPRQQPVSYEILYRLHNMAQRYVRLHLKPKGRVKRAAREHTALLDAWLSGKARAAKDATQAHIEETRDELAAYLARGD
jgi:DNA-binding GntR family transcriptional regulator